MLIGRLPDAPETVLPLDSTEFLGTAFFVTKNGIAFTAAHLVPSPEDLNENHLLAVVWDGRTPQVHRVAASLVPNGTDLAILRIQGLRTPYLPTSFRRVHMGEDVEAIGIPNDSTWGTDRDFRVFKGHVTRTRRFLELSFPALRGLSGGPVFCDGQVIAVLSGNHRSEALEDQVSEIEETAHGVTNITRVETKAVVNYGLAEPLFLLNEFQNEMFGADTLPQFINRMNVPTDP